MDATLNRKAMMNESRSALFDSVIILAFLNVIRKRFEVFKRVFFFTSAAAGDMQHITEHKIST